MKISSSALVTTILGAVTPSSSGAHLRRKAGESHHSHALDNRGTKNRLGSTSWNSARARGRITTESAAQFDFSPIPPATSIEESNSTYAARQDKVIQWFTEGSLPVCENSDNDNSTNCFLDSRTDAREICDYTVSRIIRGEDVSEAEAIFLNETTIPFGIVGTGVNKYDPNDFCFRKGDYDFSLIDFLHVAYTHLEHPGVFSEAAYLRIVNVLLTHYGNEHKKVYTLDCGNFEFVFGETENHIFREEIAQYLTNQLLLPLNPGNSTYDNEANGNNEYMLNYLKGFFDDYFYEFNSRPYEEYNLLPLALLYKYAENAEVALAAEMLLDLISGWTAMQSNKLRRFAPFRRQEKYIVPDEGLNSSQGWYAWAGDGELERLAMTAGNYGYLETLNWTLPEGDGQRHFVLYAATSEYRMNDVLLDLAIGGADNEPYFVVSSHDTVEMYYSEPNFLLSAGGVYVVGEPLGLNNFDGVPSDIVELVMNIFNQEEAGWAQVTSLVPTNEASSDIRDMMQFQGHQDLEKRHNTCVGPGFMCGLTPNLGNLVEAVVDECSYLVNNTWQFFDFRSSSGCSLDYGILVALYTEDCDTAACSNASSTNSYGLLEVTEATESTSAAAFAQNVTINNPGQFSSRGVHTYTTVSGDAIEFEIYPDEELSLIQHQTSLISLNGVEYGRDTRFWPLARGSNSLLSTTAGRLTFDSPNVGTAGKRLILDMTEPQNPRKFYVDLPSLTFSDDEVGSVGTYFDDSGAVMTGAFVSNVTITYSNNTLQSLSVTWASGLESTHGEEDGSTSESLILGPGEYISEVAVSKEILSVAIDYIMIKTNQGNEITFGTRGVGDYQKFRAPEGEQIIAFFGHTTPDMTAYYDGPSTDVKVQGLGVVYMSL